MPSPALGFRQTGSSNAKGSKRVLFAAAAAAEGDIPLLETYLTKAGAR